MPPAQVQKRRYLRQRADCVERPDHADAERRSRYQRRLCRRPKRRDPQHWRRQSRFARRQYRHGQRYGDSECGDRPRSYRVGKHWLGVDLLQSGKWLHDPGELFHERQHRTRRGIWRQGCRRRGRPAPAIHAGERPPISPPSAQSATSATNTRSAYELNASGFTGFAAGSTFTGTLTGNGGLGTISKIDNLSGRNLFPFIGATGKVSNLDFTNVTITANANSQFIGPLAGQNAGTITNVDVLSGTVNAGTFSGIIAGGLVGQNTGNLSIHNSSSAATVTGGNARPALAAATRPAAWSARTSAPLPIPPQAASSPAAPTPSLAASRGATTAERFRRRRQAAMSQRRGKCLRHDDGRSGRLQQRHHQFGLERKRQRRDRRGRLRWWTCRAERGDDLGIECLRQRQRHRRLGQYRFARRPRRQQSLDQHHHFERDW